MGDAVSSSGERGVPADPRISAVLAGDRAAFEEIVRSHQDRVYSFCARMLSDKDEALDAAQEVFLAAFRHIDGFRGDSTLSTWLLRIAANNCLNRIRRRGTRAGKELTAKNYDDGDEMALEIPGGEEHRPDRIAETREIGRVLEAALARIEPGTRSLLLLLDVEGFTNEEVAEMARIPVGTVKSRVHRARMALRKMLAPVG